MEEHPWERSQAIWGNANCVSGLGAGVKYCVKAVVCLWCCWCVCVVNQLLLEASEPDWFKSHTHTHTALCACVCV